jgi:hypothetical protein
MENQVEEQEIETFEEEEIESEETETEETDEIEEEEVIYTFGEDSPPQEEDVNEEVPKKLRQEIRERNKRIKELETKLQETQPKETQPTLGARPTLESCDYDEDVLSSKLDEWYDKKLAYDNKQREIESQQRAAQQEWEAKLNGYAESRANVKAADYDDAESVVMEVFNEVQQGMIIQGANNAAALVYALGKNPSKAKELASIKDPVKFAWEASKLEGSMRTVSRKPKSVPEKTVKGNSSLSGVTDGKLEKLRAEAAKTGDMSKVYAYKRELSKKG